MANVAIIPARGGSKGIPGKNIIDLGGKPLLQWTVEAALEAQQVDRVIVSTDCEQIADVARACGAEVPYLRPAALAADEVHSIHAVLNVLNWLQQNEHALPEHCAMLLPTSPLRSSQDIDRGMQRLAEDPEHSVIGITEARVPIISLRWVREDRLEPIGEFPNLQLQRQDGDTLYRVNGAFFAASCEKLLKDQTFHSPDARPLLMNGHHSLDINTPDELALARVLIQHPELFS
ncbi:cytidylyltransferase domain-containing protein [Motiliproteus sp.]|uniref:acylneuraminate cytidylyltransferase family protein n=1 Tax=Motiliproteus sp. TaxID=1898955 RepID=UPI003BA8FF2D